MEERIAKFAVIVSILCMFAIVMASPSDCAAADLPDPQFTPGALDPAVVDQALTLDQICNESTKSRRNVTKADKAQTFAAYGLQQEHRPDCTGPQNACYEIDHACSLELGCNNIAANRWPQLYEIGAEPYEGQWGAHKKDHLENRLHREVCVTKTMSLEDAQQCISANWIECYQRVMP